MVKKVIKRSTFICIITLLIMLFTGCMEEETIEKKELPTLQNISGNNLILEKPVENGMVLKVTYDTGDYDLSKWRITDTKTLNISAIVDNIPEGCIVLMGHMHADVSIASTSAQVDGLAQDSMDNSYPGTSQDGYFISSKYPYTATFIIGGFSKDLIEGWGFISGDTGYSDLSQKRLTEKVLVEDADVYGSKIQIEYNLSIKYAGEKYFHKVSVFQELLIPVTYISQTNKD